MKPTLHVFFGLAIVLLFCIPQIECETVEFRPYSPKQYKINLDLPPKQRWAEIITDFKPQIHAFRAHIIDQLGVSPFWLHFVPYSFLWSYDSEFAEEIRAISALAEIGFNEVYILNFLYELFAVKACTSIVFRTDSGRIVHGRNLDYFSQEFMANLSSVGIFYRNGTAPLYQANIIAGYIGFTSGFKFGKFGITLNQREAASFWNNLGAYYLHTSVPSAYLIRKVLEQAHSFDEAVTMLSKTRIIAPSYFIVSGTRPHEGVVITRGSNDVYNTTWLADNNPRWFVAHTNYDRDQPDPGYDRRRVPAEKKLARRRKGLSEQGLMDLVLSQYPNRNSQTILTVIFSAETGYFNTTMWY